MFPPLIAPEEALSSVTAHAGAVERPRYRTQGFSQFDANTRHKKIMRSASVSLDPAQ
jgi:hypothetical protein